MGSLALVVRTLGLGTSIDGAQPPTWTSERRLGRHILHLLALHFLSAASWSQCRSNPARAHPYLGLAHASEPRPLVDAFLLRKSPL